MYNFNKTDYSFLCNNIRKNLKNYIKDNNLLSLVVGESGGVDSALTSALAYPVCEVMNIPLIGRSITIDSNKSDEIERGRKIGTVYCHDFEELNLTPEYENFIEKKSIRDPSIIEDTLESKIRRGNIKARLRMIELYDIAQDNKGIVLSTDNFTELALGFWTLHGDVGDLGMIQKLFKTEVYKLSSWIACSTIDGKQKEALQSCIDATPTDGLGITNSDLDQLGANTYEEVDNILIEYFKYKKNIDHPVVRRHLKTNFKRNNPYNFRRDIILGQPDELCAYTDII